MRPALSALPLLMALSCSEQPSLGTPCATDTECESAMGEGSICLEDGYCSIAAASQVTMCESAADCVAAEGFGSTCDLTTMTCGQLRMHERCTRSEPIDLCFGDPQYGDRLVLGTIHDSTNPNHRAREDAMRAAVRLLNESTPMVDANGEERLFGIIFCDQAPHNATADLYENDEFNSREASVASAEWLVNGAGVSVVLGPSGDEEILEAFEQVVRPTEGRVIQLAPGALSKELGTTDLHPTPSDERPGVLWPIGAPVHRDGEALAYDALTRSTLNDVSVGAAGAVQSIALLHSNSARCTDVIQGFEGANEALATLLERETLSTESFIFADADEMASQTDALSARLAEFDAVLFSGSASETQRFVEHISATDSPWLTASNLPIYLPRTGHSAAHTASPVLDRILVSSARIDRSTPEYETFAAEFTTLNGGSPEVFTETELAWDTVYLAAMGVVWSVVQEGELRGEYVGAGLRQLSTSQHIADATTGFGRTGWDVFLSEVSHGHGVDAAGASGALDFDPATETTDATMQVGKPFCVDEACLSIASSPVWVCPASQSISPCVAP